MDTTPLGTTLHRTSRILLVALVAVITACGRRAAPAPSPTPTWWTVGVAPSATPVPTATPVPGETVPSTVPGPLPTPTSSSQPAVIGAYVTSYLPGWGERPAGIAVLGKRTYVANQRSHNVSIIAGEAVERVVPVGASPGPIAADPTSGRVFVLNQGDNTISVIRGTDPVATWELPEPCASLAVAEGRLWVGSVQGGRIHLLATGDGARLGQTTVDTGSTVLAMVSAPDASVMLVATYNRTTALDAATLTAVARAELTSYSTLAVSADGRRVYVNDFDADERTSYLVALDAADLEEVARLPLPPDPAEALADPRNDRIYLLSARAGALLAIEGASMEVVATIPVGLEPRHLALDPASGRLFVANRLGDSVAVVDTGHLTVTNTIPLAARIEAMDVDVETGTLYVASGSADRVLAFGDDGLRSDWCVGRHPSGVALLPDGEQLAVLLRGEDRLALLDPSGDTVAAYPTGRDPMGLTVDEAAGRVYAGDLVLDLASGVTESLRVQTVMGSEEPPVRVAVDTRRGQAYAVAFNGVPGTNGGNVAARIVDGAAGPGSPGPGRVGIGQLVYDAAVDRFYATIARLAENGLQVSDAETLKELYFLPLDGRPSAAALNAATHHLWLALPVPDDASEVETRLVALDTRNLGTAAEITVDGRVRSLAVDPRRNLVYAGVDGVGDIVVVQDVAMPAPPQPANLQMPAPAITATPEPTAAPTAPATATRVPTAVASPTLTRVPVLSPTPTREDPCSNEPDARLQDAYRRFGAEALGCPRESAIASNWAWQPYERGEMVWHGTTGVIYVFEEDGGWRGYKDDWRDGMPALSCEAGAPVGLLQPVRGFGRIWCLVGDVREGAGWATDSESAVSGISQAFDGGLLMLWDDNPRLLRGDGTWVAP